MTSLSNECIESIKNIDNCIFEAQIAVGESMLNAYAKHFKLMCEQTEFIQESGSFWTPQREDGESIFKTIFLFIPRLIVALFNGIKNKWNELRFKFMTPDQKELVRLSEMSYAERIVEAINDPRFTCKGKKGEQCTFYIRTKIPNFEKLIDYYTTTCGIFNSYLYFIDENNVNAAFEKISEVNTDNNVYQFATVFRNELVEKEYDIKATPLVITTFGDFHKKIIKDIKEIMEKIMTWYHKQTKKESIDLFHKDYYRSANRFISALQKSYDDMAKNDIKVLAEMDDLLALIQKINVVSHDVYLSMEKENKKK